FMFEKKGVFIFDPSLITEDKLMEAALNAGADDVITNTDDNVFEVYSDPAAFHKVKTAFDASGVKYQRSEITMLPKVTVKVEGKTARQLLDFLEGLEDLDDVQAVYANFDISAEELDKLS
ncbi:YebC/PmpR family DNA-binding transcriptional regulator, partial [bacterium]